MLLEVKEEYKLAPQLRSYKGKIYAIGGSITVERSAPKVPFTYQEATQKDYQELFNMGVTKFFKIDEKIKNEKSRTGKSDTGTDKGPGTDTRTV